MAFFETFVHIEATYILWQSLGEEYSEDKSMLMMLVFVPTLEIF